MEFKLTYTGRLFASSNNQRRGDHKHDLRRTFHPRLKRLWDTADALGKRKADRPDTPVKHCWQGREEYQIPFSEAVAAEHKQSGFRFCPLVTEALAMHCVLNILPLRPEPPGRIIISGDIDGRVKTIFDALRKPVGASELAGHAPQTGEDPMYVLLEDDKLVSGVSVETATMLEPVDGSYDAHDCRLIISVTTRVTRQMWHNTDFA